ncbi:CTP synthase [Dirofilaria immitis]
MEFNIDSVFDLLYNGFSRKFLLHCDKSTKKNSNTCLLKISDSYGRYDRLLECCYGLFELSNTSNFQMLQIDTCFSWSNYYLRKAMFMDRFFSSMCDELRSCYFYLRR